MLKNMHNVKSLDFCVRWFLNRDLTQEIALLNTQCLQKHLYLNFRRDRDLTFFRFQNFVDCFRSHTVQLRWEKYIYFNSARCAVFTNSLLSKSASRWMLNGRSFKYAVAPKLINTQFLLPASIFSHTSTFDKNNARHRLIHWTRVYPRTNNYHLHQFAWLPPNYN